MKEFGEKDFVSCKNFSSRLKWVKMEITQMSTIYHKNKNP